MIFLNSVESCLVSTALAARLIKHLRGSRESANVTLVTKILDLSLNNQFSYNLHPHLRSFFMFYIRLQKFLFFVLYIDRLTVPKNLRGEIQFCLSVKKFEVNYNFGSMTNNLWVELQFCITVRKSL